MTKDITTLIDSDAIKSSIKNIIFTNLKKNHLFKILVVIFVIICLNLLIH